MSISIPFTASSASGMLAFETASDDSESESLERTARTSRPPSNHGRSLRHEESYDTHTLYTATQNASSSPYRYEELQKVLDAANKAVNTVDARRKANQTVMETLAKLGVSVFLITYECDNVWKEVKHCIFEASSMAICNCSMDRCLLYEDEKGRLFNLKMAGDFSGLINSYDSMLDKASGLEAICAFVVLVRAFACVGKACTCVRGLQAM
jgi:hypothetical protein